MLFGLLQDKRNSCYEKFSGICVSKICDKNYAIHMQVYTISNRGLDSSLPLYYI